MLKMPDRTVVVGDIKLAIIAILLFVESLIAGVIPITQEGKWPNEFQMVTILLVAILAAVTYAISILKGTKD
jgi:hypothetical protein